MTRQILKAYYKQVIRQDMDLQLKICKASREGKGVSYRTLDKWLQEDSDRLTTATVIDSIRQHLGLSESEVLTEAKKEAAGTMQS